MTTTNTTTDTFLPTAKQTPGTLSHALHSEIIMQLTKMAYAVDPLNAVAMRQEAEALDELEFEVRHDEDLLYRALLHYCATAHATALDSKVGGVRICIAAMVQTLLSKF